MAELIGGAAVGAVFGELLKTVLEMKEKAVSFKQILTDLRSTLEAIAPVIKEVEQHNNDLGRPKEELKRLIKQMEDGTKLVSKCSKVHRLNYIARIRYQEQLWSLLTSLKFIEMQAQTARDQKETLLVVRRILSRVNKLPFGSTEVTASSDSGPVHLDVSELELQDSTETQPDENEMGIDFTEEVIDSDIVPVDVTDSESFYSAVTQLSGTHSVEQFMKDAISLTLVQVLSQIEAKAENNQAMEHLMSEKSYDQLFTSKKSLFGIHLPKIEPVIPKIGGFNCLVEGAPLKPPFGKFITLEGCPYDFRDILGASIEVIENRSYGATYKAILEDGTMLVANRLKDVVVGKKEFKQQMEILQRLSQHPNVMPLPLAYYYSKGDVLLIHEYMKADSFSSLLHGTGDSRGTQLDWDSRLKISLGAAKGVAHIHSQSTRERKIVHGNITSSNVLVTRDLQGCILDFGLTRLANLSVSEGYQAPEYVRKGELTHKSDVYSFGVLLLEMLTGESPGEHSDLPSFVDGEIIDGLSFVLFDHANPATTRLEMMNLARDCVARMPDLRPSMDKVVRIMEGVIEPNRCNLQWRVRPVQV